jgi:hypothetical protein
MGDFDRHAKQNEAAQSKKLIMVGVLGAVLVGVVAMQFMKGPAVADASALPGAGGGSAAQAPEESPEVLRASLLKDPTPELLAAGPRAKTVVPIERNPFAMAHTWRTALAPKEPTPEPTPVAVTVQPEPVAPVIAAPQPLELKAADYKLSMILVSNNQYIALINGLTVSTGSRIKDALVLDVQADTVVLRHKDFENGKPLRLQLKPN